MQSFLLPLTGGSTTGPPAPLLAGKEAEAATAELLVGTLPPEFGDVFAADALAVAAEDVADQIARPSPEEEVEAPELATADGDNVLKIEGGETEEPKFLPTQPLPLTTSRSDQIPAEIPRFPEVTTKTALPKGTDISVEDSRLSPQNTAAQAMAQPATSIASAAALQALSAMPEQRNTLQTMPQTLAVTRDQVVPVMPQPVPASPSAPAQIMAAIVQRQETGPPPPALPKQPSAAAPTGVKAPQIIPLTITTPPANTRQDTSEKASAAPLEAFALGRSDGPAAPQSTTIPAAARADLAGHVARQIADVAHHMPARPVEITLSPEELGRVRLTVSTHESGIVLNIVAERPETVDLLRRHIGQLGQQFQSLGYESIAFSFSGGGDAQTSDHQEGDAAPQSAPTEDSDIPALQIKLATGTAAGVDLRL